MGKEVFIVRAIWDEEAEIWSVEDSDVPGLATWAYTIEELQEKLQIMIPELLEANSTPVAANPIPFELRTERLAYA